MMPSSLLTVRKSLGWTNLSSGFQMHFTKMELENRQETSEDHRNTESILFLFIPGNPGNDGFYEEFGEALLRQYFSKTGHKRVEFIAAAHLNHVPFDYKDNKEVKQEQRRFNLDEQIQAKIDFCRTLDANEKPQPKRVYLIGHSIGAYISLRLLPHLLADDWNVISCFCLFPTVEQMALTPNGRWVGTLAKIVDQFDWLFRWAFSLVNLLPVKIKHWLVERFLSANTPKCVIDAVVNLANPLVARNCAHMANHELHVVRNFDDSLLGEPKWERIVFFYGRNDKWAPVEFAERMRQRLPDAGRVLVDSTNESDPLEHAFVLRHSKEMAELLVDILLKGA